MPTVVDSKLNPNKLHQLERWLSSYGLITLTDAGRESQVTPLSLQGPDKHNWIHVTGTTVAINLAFPQILDQHPGVLMTPLGFSLITITWSPYLITKTLFWFVQNKIRTILLINLIPYMPQLVCHVSTLWAVQESFPSHLI